jgi:two-component system OmpR family response regulator
MPSVLVIEDDPSMGAAMVRGLRKAGFEVELATDGQQGLERALDPSFALVVLDLMLPERDGLEVLRHVHARVSTPVIVVTARTDLPDRLRAFELGAVDFLPKPFFVEELLARIHVRLGTRATQGKVVRFGAAELDLDARALRVDAMPVHATPSEVALLAYLVSRPGRAIGRAELVQTLSELEESSPRNVDTHIAHLRKKLGSASAAIVTVWAHGYRFDPDRSR